ncbi:MAG: ATP synthase subunit I [Deltaproteobacteria bacterium]|nr:ATP synthase subunit I [Deltaproteobacteria bacterium]MCB9479296.1 ATP synthase subunit I [Deltaproteobacteria bacterium]MCB9488740.1 ATP synthase subunit I [Deltaproteobacteria bacterium]
MTTTPKIENLQQYPSDASDSSVLLPLIEKIGLLAYTALAFGSLVFRDLDIFVGVLVGGAFALGNFRALRWLIGRALGDQENPKPGYLALLIPKFAVIAAFLWWATVSGVLNMVAFLAGTLSLLIGIFGAGLVSPKGRPPATTSGQGGAENLGPGPDSPDGTDPAGSVPGRVPGSVPGNVPGNVRSESS